MIRIPLFKPLIPQIASGRRGSLLIHVVFLSIWSAFYFFPARFVDSATGAFAGLVVYFASLISQWDNDYFSLELFVYYVVLGKVTLVFKAAFGHWLHMYTVPYIAAAFLFYAFGTQKYYREKAQRIQFFSNMEQMLLERDTRAIR